MGDPDELSRASTRSPSNYLENLGLPAHVLEKAARARADMAQAESELLGSFVGDNAPSSLGELAVQISRPAVFDAALGYLPHGYPPLAYKLSSRLATLTCTDEQFARLAGAVVAADLAGQDAIALTLSGALTSSTNVRRTDADRLSVLLDLATNTTLRFVRKTVVWELRRFAAVDDVREALIRLTDDPAVASTAAEALARGRGTT